MTGKKVLLILILIMTIFAIHAVKNKSKRDTFTSGNGCFCKVNLNKECPFWADDSRCAMRNCAVNVCSEEQLPDGLKAQTEQHDENNDEAQKDCDGEDLGYLNTTISEEREKAFQNWTKYDDAQETFCEMDDDTSPDMKYVDLLLNPEKYTGYKGESPHRIWNSIYNENCFKAPEQPAYNPQALSAKNCSNTDGACTIKKKKKGKHREKNHLKNNTSYKRQFDELMSGHCGNSQDYSLEGLCLEKRAFYRMVSGLHTSINIHLCHNYLFPASTCYGKEEWGLNLEEFQQRFDHAQTDGRGPQWLKNLYFTYLVELRALAKAAPYFEEEGFFTGDEEEDADVKQGVQDLLSVIKEFPEQFDESKLFKGNKKVARALKREFRDHFLNISRIMDCVGCDKCKLWGKLQVQGMGTALKILFSGDGMGPQSIVKAGSKNKFQLRRTEIVSLFNAFGRLSSSIHAIEEFRRLLR
ncbi:ERO1-like protein beta isoform X2 [Mercenaria mercenaria]|uniref:ERO1-like protein beta isoform X2 n=1 Tax=Mercenaria mercenaria TaxID=6596 RepID=UPI00234F9ECD|nr:ERO1-like protein beta isoform X2 [Mercenaria mercenaria]